MYGPRLDPEMYDDGDWVLLLDPGGGAGSGSTTSGTYVDHGGAANLTVIDLDIVNEFDWVESTPYLQFDCTTWGDGTVTAYGRAYDQTNGVALTGTEVSNTAASAAAGAEVSPRVAYDQSGVAAFIPQMKSGDGATTINQAGNPSLRLWGKVQK